VPAPLQNLHNILEGAYLSQDTTAVPSPHHLATLDSESARNEDGTWGERDMGSPVRREDAMIEYEELRDELSRLSMQRTHGRASTVNRERGGLVRIITSQRTHPQRTRSAITAITSDATDDIEAGDKEAEEGPDFDVGAFLKDGHFEKRTEAGESAKKVGVVYKNLTVKGVGVSVAFVRTVPHAIIGTFGPDLYRLLCRFIPALRFGRHPPTRDLIHDFSGIVRDGEMMLVLGRPGSGCSTFLKGIANDRSSFAAVEGEVTYGGISAEDQRKFYRGEVNYNPEDDQHFPTLTVWQTLRFALMNKTKVRRLKNLTY
jgi:ATP-binding cassette subfamily G (WHITE) protein 2 (SNQ2)